MLAHEALSESDQEGVGEEGAREKEANIKPNTRESLLLKNVWSALSAYKQISDKNKEKTTMDT